MNELTCGTCLRDFTSWATLGNHLSRYPSHHYRDVKISLHLTPEDCSTKNPDKAAIKHVGARARQIHKSGIKFTRKCILAHKAAIARHAKRHGWKPKNDVRHLGDIHI